MMGGESQPALFRAASVAAAIFLTVFVMTPMAAPVLVPAAALAMVVGFAAEVGRVPLVRPSRLFLGLAVVGGYLLVNCSWSHAPSSAYAAVGLYFVLVIGALLAVQTLNESSGGMVRAIALGICIGVALGTVLFCFEIFGGQSVRRTLMSYVPSLRAKAPEVLVQGDWVTSMPAYLLNRNAAALSLCLWPTLLMIGQVCAGGWRKALLYAVAGGGALAIMASDHETSKLACIGGALIYAISRFSLSAARRLTVAGWAAATLLVVPVSTFAYSQGLYLASWLPASAQHRVIIWSYIAEQVASAPVLGVGINSTRAISAQTGDGAEVAPGSKYIRITKSHSHSIYLQAWYETGAVGAGMLFALGLLLLRSLRSAPERMHPCLYAAFVTGALVAASSFSLWAMWFMASFALAAMLAFVGICLGQKAQRTTIDSNRSAGTAGSLTEGMRV